MSSLPTDLETAAGVADGTGTPAGGGSRALVDVLMPKMGSSVVEGTVVGWNVAVGDAVVADEALCVISTDKVDSECPSPASGVLAELLVAEGETVDVGTVIGRVAVGDGLGAAGGGGDDAGVGAAGTGGDDAAGAGTAGGAGGAAGAGVAGNRRTTDAGTGAGTEGLSSAAAQIDPTRQASVAHGGAPANVLSGTRPTRRETLRRSSPVAAKIAAEHGIDVLALSGSGRNGRVTKADVLREVQRQETSATPFDAMAAAEPPMHIETPYRRDPSTPVAGVSDGTGAGRDTGPLSTSPAQGRTTRQGAPAGTPDEGTVVPLDRMRTAIGAQMRKALDTAAHATTIVECDMSRIERQRRELGVTALPLVARHVLDTLREFPALNATFDGQTLTRFDRVHLGVAVSLGEDGLIVPVLHDAHELAPAGLAQRIKDVARRARSGELLPDDVRGGTFTITNPGAAGALVATPIINVPQVAILDLEAIVKRPVVVTDSDGQDSIAIRPMTHLCMSWDHRVLDGMYAARFLTALRGRIEGRS